MLQKLEQPSKKRWATSMEYRLLNFTIFSIVTLFFFMVQFGVSEGMSLKQACDVQKDADYKIIGIEKPFLTVIFKNEKIGMICLCSPQQADVISPIPLDAEVEEMLMANKVDLYFHQCMNERLYEIKKPKY